MSCCKFQILIAFEVPAPGYASMASETEGYNRGLRMELSHIQQSPFTHTLHYILIMLLSFFGIFPIVLALVASVMAAPFPITEDKSPIIQ